MVNYDDEPLFHVDSVDKQILMVSDEGGHIRITNDDIIGESFELTESLCSEENLRLNSVESSQIKFRVKNTFPTLYRTWFTVTITIDGAEEPFLLGRYKVWKEKISSDKSTREITAYDGLHKILTNTYKRWYNNFWKGKSTATIKQLRTSFFNRLRVTHPWIYEIEADLVNDDVALKKSKKIKNPSGKDILGAICELNGVCGRIGRDNKFHYIEINEPATVYPIDNSLNIVDEYEEYKTENIDRVEILSQDGEVLGAAGESQDDAVNTYRIANGFLLKGLGNNSGAKSKANTLAMGILSKINNATYTPFEAEFKGNPCYEVGDRISFTAHGNTISTLVLNRTMRGVQSLHDVYSATGDDTYPDDTNTYSSQIQNLSNQVDSQSQITVGSTSPDYGSEGDVHFTAGAGIDDEIIQTDNIHPQSTTQHPIRLYDFTGDYSSGYNFKVDGNPDGHGNGETILIDVEGLEVGGQYHVEFDLQFTKANGGWMSGHNDQASFCGTSIVFAKDRNLHSYETDFTYSENSRIGLYFYGLWDNYDYTAVFSNMIFTPVDEDVKSVSVYHNDQWNNVDYVKKVTQVVTSGTQVATAENSDGTTTDIYVQNMSGASASAAGSNGLVPAPASGDESKFLRGDGTWQNAGGGTSALSELTDVELTDLADGEILKYDATEEKWVNAEDGGSGGGSVVALPTLYSTKEKMVGLWTDNKPLYQKTIVNNNGISSTETWTEIADIGNTCDIKVVEGKIATAVGEVPFDYYGQGANVSYIANMNASVVKTYGKISAILNSGANWLRNLPLTMTVQYTKTTDTPVEDFNLQDFGIFAPVIYSLEEREIGVWTDGKPLYQKTIYSTSQVTLVNTEWRTIPWVNAPSNVENLIHAKFAGIVPYSNAFFRFYADNGVIKGAAYNTYDFPPTQAPIYVTIQYTKTTDTPGSGSYAELGIPAVHIDDTERVIGTWFGETLYQKTIFTNPTWSGNITASIPVDANFLIHNISGGICNEYGAEIVPFGYVNVNPTEYVRIYNASSTLAVYNSFVSSRPYVLATIQYTKTS